MTNGQCFFGWAKRWSKKTYLHKKHIKHRAAANTEQHILFPFMQEKDQEDRHEFGQSMIGTAKGIFEAIDDQEAHHRIRQHSPQIGDDGGRSLIDVYKRQAPETPCACSKALSN